MICLYNVTPFSATYFITSLPFCITILCVEILFHRFDYVTQKGRSYVQLLVTLCVFSTIVPSYMIYVKRPCNFLCAIRALRETDSCT